MIIKDKEALKKGIKEEIERFVKDFPVYFFGNILFIFILVGALIFSGVIIAIDLSLDIGTPELSGSACVAIVIILPILKIFFDALRRNVKVLNNIRKGNYTFGVESHEMGNAIECIEDLPMSVEEVERLKTSLSFGKIIDVLEATRIISIQNGVYYFDLRFKYTFDEIIVEDFEKLT